MKVLKERTLTESINDLLERITPEQQADSDKLRTIVKKLNNAWRSTNKKEILTDDERALLKKYNLGVNKWDKVVPTEYADKDPNKTPRRYNLNDVVDYPSAKVSSKDNGWDPKVNITDLVQKRLARDKAGSSFLSTKQGKKLGDDYFNPGAYDVNDNELRFTRSSAEKNIDRDKNWGYYRDRRKKYKPVTQDEVDDFLKDAKKDRSSIYQNAERANNARLTQKNVNDYKYNKAFLADTQNDFDGYEASKERIRKYYNDKLNQELNKMDSEHSELIDKRNKAQGDIDRLLKRKPQTEALENETTLNKNDISLQSQNILDVEDKAHIEVNPTYGSAMKDMKKTSKIRDEMINKQIKDATDKSNEGPVETKIKGTPEQKKMHLSESLFEELDESLNEKKMIDLEDVVYDELAKLTFSTKWGNQHYEVYSNPETNGFRIEANTTENLDKAIKIAKKYGLGYSLRPVRDYYLFTVTLPENTLVSADQSLSPAL